MVLIVSVSTICQAFAQVSTYRPDLVWAIGQDQSTNSCFGMNQVRFDGGTVEVFDLDSVGIQSFWSSNVQYKHPYFSLYGNSYRLTEGFNDSIISHLNYDTWSYRRDQGSALGYGFQALLPLGDDRIAYVSETLYESDGSTPYFFYTPGIVVSHLSLDSLLSQQSILNSVVNTSLVLLSDTIVRRVAEHVPNPAGGWYGIARSAVSKELPMWQIFRDSTIVLMPQEVDSTGLYREASILDITFRPSGDAFAISGSYAGLGLYYFDRISGTISLWEELGTSYDPEFEPITVFTRSEWSADGRYLYVTTEKNIFQFDTKSPDIAGSTVQINDPASIPFRGSYGQIERGPDCRLYVARSGQGKTLSVIDKPSRPGRACELEDSGLLLPNYYYVSIPDFPEYSLWAKDRVARGLAPIIDTAVCDSSIQAYDYFDWTTSTREVLAEAETLTISPNPARGGEVLSIDYELPSALQSELNKSLKASLYSLSGQKMGNIGLLSIDEYRAQVQLPDGVPAGVYRLLIASSERPLLEGKVMVR